MTDFAAPAFARPHRHWSRPRAYAGLAGAYLIAYVALNLVTDHRSLGNSSITLWSPDDALSLLFIMESWAFAPVLWLAQVAVDNMLGHGGQSVAADAFVEAVLAAGYLGLAWALKRRFQLDVRTIGPRDLIALMAVLPVGLAIVGFLYCGALVEVGGLARGEFLTCYAGFWIGDAAAMCVMIPAAGAMYRVIMSDTLRGPKFAPPVLAFAAMLGYVALVVCISAQSVENRYLFNLLFPPILLVGMKYGFDAGALALLLVQLLLLLALELFHVGDREFGAYQILMFILAISGLALGAAFTEREAATSLLRRQQAELAKVSERATNGALAAAMSHEISQPLASIATYLFAARRLLENGAPSDKALSALRKAEGEAGRARNIVERLRDFVANGPVELERVCLGDVIGAVLRLQEDAARERGVELLGDFDAAEASTVLVDRVAVEQAISNLVLNAIEAAPAGNGRVVVKLERVGDTAVVAVEDNGRGVAAEIAERLFEPFETTKPRGMGLGLPLAKEIATRHRGALNWRPTARGGARFELELPLT